MFIHQNETRNHEDITGEGSSPPKAAGSQKTRIVSLDAQHP
mgnify:CR=1 FL=1